MSQFGAPFQINVGDRVTIKALNITVTGTVLSADWWGKEDGWYIEMKDANVPGGYSYYKQRYDKGNVTHVNGVAI